MEWSMKILGSYWSKRSKKLYPQSIYKCDDHNSRSMSYFNDLQEKTKLKFVK